MLCFFRVILLRDSIADFQILNKYFVKRDAEKEYERLLDAADAIEGRFGRKFYLHVFNTIKTDSVDLYLDLCDSLKGRMKNARELKPSQNAIYKWISAHHLLCFSAKEEGEKVGKLTDLIFSLFTWSSADKERFIRLRELSLTSLPVFESEFTEYIIQFFVKENPDGNFNSPVTLAFVNNFFYNSYNAFIASLTNYASLSTLMNEQSKDRSAARS